MLVITWHKPSYIPTPRQKKEEKEKLGQKLRQRDFENTWRGKY